jgi:hypothetical protein
MTVMTRRDEREWQSYYLPDDYFFKEHVHVKLYNGVPTAWVEQVDSDCQR